MAGALPAMFVGTCALSRHGHAAAVVALAYVLRRSEVTGAIVGARSAAQVEGWIAALDFRLDPDEVAEIEAFLAQNP